MIDLSAHAEPGMTRRDKLKKMVIKFILLPYSRPCSNYMLQVGWLCADMSVFDKPRPPLVGFCTSARPCAMTNHCHGLSSKGGVQTNIASPHCFADGRETWQVDSRNSNA
jgi:hypothetical protein